jgi:hypothetical protein
VTVAQLIDMLQTMVEEDKGIAWVPVVSDGDWPISDAFKDERCIGDALKEVVVLY